MPRYIQRFLLGLGLLCYLPSTFALSNQLKNHPSPYLAMHAADPVAWQDWGPAAVKQARQEGKLLYLSIGYFSCHWCHVMQRESYQNRDIARFLNGNFIPVKIDRELQPALDMRMIEFAEATRGQAGWPLNVFITPDGHPLYAVLYMPPQEFHALLQKLQKLWVDDRAALMRLAQHDAVAPQGPGAPDLNADETRALSEQVTAGALALADTIHGGFGEQSKFPSAPQLAFLLARQASQPDARLKEFLILTLDQMMQQGLYDHIGGGFFRYTVDPSWKTPHFEKMLYDNALLAKVYLQAARVFGREDYRAVARGTLNFMAREMRDSSGAFIASLSAVDNKGVEGGYYLWTKDELMARLPRASHEVFFAAFGITDAAPFDAGYLPIQQMSVAEVAAKLKLDTKTVQARLTEAVQILYKSRQKRRLPRDQKLLAGWNGLALSAYAEAALLTGDRDLRAQAQGIRDYIINKLWDGSALRRAVAGKRSVGTVALEDYAYVADGLLQWAKLSGRDDDYAAAKKVTVAAWERFYTPRGWRLAEESLIQAEAGQDAVADGPMPSPSGLLAATSFELAVRGDDNALRQQVLAALNSGQGLIKKDAFWYATHVRAMLLASDRR